MTEQRLLELEAEFHTMGLDEEQACELFNEMRRVRATWLEPRQVEALVSWANEGDRRGGTTAWGPKFDAVMFVARTVRDRQKTSEER